VVSRVSHSYIQRAYHSLIIDIRQFYQCVAGARGCETRRGSDRLFSAQLCSLECDEPGEAEEHEENDDSLGNDAVETPYLQDVFFNVGEIEGESEAEKRGDEKEEAPAR